MQGSIYTVEERCCTSLCNTISLWCGQRNAIKSQICFDVYVSTTPVEVSLAGMSVSKQFFVANEEAGIALILTNSQWPTWCGDKLPPHFEGGAELTHGQKKPAPSGARTCKCRLQPATFWLHVSTLAIRPLHLFQFHIQS